MYFNYKKAEKLAESWIDIFSDGKCALILDATITKPYGWVFFYQSKDYLKTQRFEDMLAGNAPILVDRFNAEIIVLGTAESVEQYLLDYEKKIPAARLQMKPEYPAK